MIPRYAEKKAKNYSSLIQIQESDPALLEGRPREEEQKEEWKAIEAGTHRENIHDTNNTFKKPLMASNVLLQGHQKDVYCVKFAPNGNVLASAGFDKLVFLWDVYKNFNNFAVLKGHKNAILELNWSTDGSRIYTASADKNIGAWDVESCKRIKKIIGHKSFVNSCHPARRGPDLIVSGSDDNTTKIWDLRQKGFIHSFDNKYQVTSVSFNDTAEKVFSAGLDNQIKVWDLRKKEVEYVIYGHTDTITGISLSPDGSYLLSNAMDQTVRCWDVRPFVIGNRCVKIFQGNTHNFEKNLLRVGWSNDGSMITAGSADK